MQIMLCACVFPSLHTQYTLFRVNTLYIHPCNSKKCGGMFSFSACGELRRVYSERVSPPNEIIAKSRAHLAPSSQYSLSSLLVLNEVV